MELLLILHVYKFVQLFLSLCMFKLKIRFTKIWRSTVKESNIFQLFFSLLCNFGSTKLNSNSILINDYYNKIPQDKSKHRKKPTSTKAYTDKSTHEQNTTWTKSRTNKIPHGQKSTRIKAHTNKSPHEHGQKYKENRPQEQNFIWIEPVALLDS